MKEFKTASGTIKIKEIIPLNTWKFPIATSVRIKTIKNVLKKEIPPKGIIHIIFRHRSFLIVLLQHSNQTNNGLLTFYNVNMGATK